MRRTFQVLVLFGLWIAFSGHLGVEFLADGMITAVLATFFTSRLFRGTHEGKFRAAPDSLLWLATSALRLLAYIPWISYQIVISNLHVVYLVLHPRMPIEPSLVEFKTSLESEYARVLLAQSITVTPGTVTIDAVDDTLMVHCLSSKSRESLAGGATQAKIAWVFEEPRAERVPLRDIETIEQIDD